MSCEEAFDNIPKNWLILEVGDLVKRGILEKPMDGNHGSIHPKAKDYVNHGIPFIMAADLKNGYIDFDRCKFITHQQAKTLKKGFAKKGDVLLTHKGTIGRVALVKDLSTQYLVLTPQVTYYRVRNNKLLLNKYLLYYFMSEKFQHFFLAFAGSGSTRNYLGITHQLKLPVVLPPIEEQHRIANILSTIDDKIELNHQINQDLEEMAQAIFKSWFIDFEPFRDGEFVDSELGPIPKGWEVKELKKLVKISTESVRPNNNPEVKYEHYSIPAFDSNKFPAFDLGAEIKSNKYVVKNNSILVSKLNPTTKRIWIPLNVTSNAICSTEFINYQPIIDDNYYFVYGILNSKKFSEFLQSNVTGSTNSRQRVSPKKTLNYKIVVPNNEKIIWDYCNLVKEIFEKIHLNLLEIEDLRSVRDTLLPKLMSGEIRV